MINIDTRILDLVPSKINSEDFFILICIAKRINTKNTSYPSRETLMSESGFGRTKVSGCITNLVNAGIIERAQREVINKNGQKVFSSNLYKIKTDYLSVFVNLQDEVVEAHIEDEKTVTAFEDTQIEDTQKRSLSIKHITGSINQGSEVEKPPTATFEDSETLKLIQQHLPEFSKTPFVPGFIRHVKYKDDIPGYILFLKANKLAKLHQYKLYNRFYDDFQMSKAEEAYNANQEARREEQIAEVKQGLQREIKEAREEWEIAAKANEAWDKQDMATYEKLVKQPAYLRYYSKHQQDPVKRANFENKYNVKLPNL